MKRLTERLRIPKSDPLFRMLFFGMFFWTTLAAVGLLTALIR